MLLKQDPDPYYQSVTYDAFNHSSRTGLLYTRAINDTGTYVNNRRTDSGWVYDDDGNNTRDASYQQTYDAAGKLIHSVSHDVVGDGIEYPLQPSLDISQAYDGNGSPAKRIQISRTFGEVDPYTGHPYPPVEDVQTTYFIRSSFWEELQLPSWAEPTRFTSMQVGNASLARNGATSVLNITIR